MVFSEEQELRLQVKVNYGKYQGRQNAFGNDCEHESWFWYKGHMLHRQ